MHEFVIEGTDGEEGKYGRVANSKMVGTLFSPVQGDEDSRLTWLPHLLQRWYHFVQRGRHIG